jgi:competence protein ComEA
MAAWRGRHRSRSGALGGRHGLEWVGRYRAVFSGGILLAVAISLIAVYWVRRPEPPRVVLQQGAQQSATRPVASPQVTSLIMVHLSGEVIAPGVYRLPIGARVDDALKAAGGPTGEGDIHRLNLAARLADGQQILVPKRIDPILASNVPNASPTVGRVNINMASVAELDRLPGVGPVTAQRIVAYREQHGSFTRIEQLRDAKLVSAATFEKIKDLVGL